MVSQSVLTFGIGWMFQPECLRPGLDSGCPCLFGQYKPGPIILGHYFSGFWSISIQIQAMG